MLNDDERRLQAELDETRLVALLTELVRRPSVSGEEKPTVEHLAGFLSDHGLAVEMNRGRARAAQPGLPLGRRRWPDPPADRPQRHRSHRQRLVAAIPSAPSSTTGGSTAAAPAT